MPVVIGLTILGQAKCFFNWFIYGFLDKYLRRCSWEALYCDTDSVAVSFSSLVTEEGWREMLKDEVRENPSKYREFLEDKTKIISDGTMKDNLCYGKFKPERQGVREAIYLGNP